MDNSSSFSFFFPREMLDITTPLLCTPSPFFLLCLLLPSWVSLKNDKIPKYASRLNLIGLTSRLWNGFHSFSFILDINPRPLFSPSPSPSPLTDHRETGLTFPSSANLARVLPSTVLNFYQIPSLWFKLIPGLIWPGHRLSRINSLDTGKRSSKCELFSGIWAGEWWERFKVAPPLNNWGCRTSEVADRLTFAIQSSLRRYSPNGHRYINEAMGVTYVTDW